MKIRWKLFLLLLVFSLTPLLLVASISQHSTRKVGRAISSDIHDNLAGIVKGSLQTTAEGYSAILLRTKEALEFALMFLSNEAERALAEAGSEDSGDIYFSTDFDNAASPPPETVSPAERPGHRILYPSPVNFSHPVFLLAPGVKQDEVNRELSSLWRLTPKFRQIGSEFKGILQWIYISLESGVHVSYPGHGGYPKDYDPRLRPWYQKAKTENRGGRVVWTFPIVDATTGLVIFTGSRLLHYPDGSIAGVASLDIPITHVLMENELSAQWSTRMRSFMVESAIVPESGKTGLRILAHKDYQQKATSWTSKIDYEWLSSSDLKNFDALVEHIKSGESGYAELPYDEIDSIWAYAGIEDNTHVVVVVPKSVIMTLPEKTSSTVLHHTFSQMKITGIAALVAVVFFGLAAYFGARSTTRSFFKIAAAVRKVSEGDFTVRLDIKTGDERDQVMTAFNEMIPKLEDHYRIHKALELAQEVQQNLLPCTEPPFPGLDVFGACNYCDETGGDYFDYIQEGDQKLTAIVGDVSGHGIASALLMATARAMIRQRKAMPGDPADIMTDVNRQLSSDTEITGDFMTMFYCEYDEKSRTITWVRAGHDPAIVYDMENDAFGELDGTGIALGVDSTFTYRQYQHPFRWGQIILIGTDGIWEMLNPQGKMFGKDLLREIIRRNASLPAKEIAYAINEALNQFRSTRGAVDDVTLVVLKRRIVHVVPEKILHEPSIVRYNVQNI